jgi:hypothetical protein
VSGASAKVRQVSGYSHCIMRSNEVSVIAS